jgi:hypothetical protein
MINIYLQKQTDWAGVYCICHYAGLVVSPQVSAIVRRLDIRLKFVTCGRGSVGVQIITFQSLGVSGESMTANALFVQPRASVTKLFTAVIFSLPQSLDIDRTRLSNY